MMAFLECKDVIKIYTGLNSEVQVAALRGIELSGNEGELIAIVGPSGSGKSTLIKMLGGLEPASSGEITVGENVITSMTRRQLNRFRRESVGFLYQFPRRNLMWNLTILKNVIIPMKLAGNLSGTEKKIRAKQLLEDVGLKNRIKHKPSQLSGGEAQRAGIAVALANDPEILLADEPTGELDSATTLNIIDYFKELNYSLGKTFLVVTHDLRFARMTDKVLRIKDGRIIGVQGILGPETPDGEREELTFVDDDGNMRIPENIRRETGIGNYVRIEARNGKACLIPVNSVEKNETRKDFKKRKT
ncbi:MAG: ABC transporter ATP-binding protein [Candidatus Thorarchaeota archaeon]